MTAYNVLFVALPPFIMCIFDRDVSDELIEKYPQLYHEVKRGSYWNWVTVAGWILSGVVHSTSTSTTFFNHLVIFGSVYFINIDGLISYTGMTTGYWVQTTLFGTPLLLTVLLKFCLATRTFVWPTWTALLISIALNTIVLFILEELDYSEPGTALINHLGPVYYLTAFLLPVLCNVPDLAFMYGKRREFPHDADLIGEEVRRGKIGVHEDVEMEVVEQSK
jgi:phospholipid-transporting ATPase